MPRFIGCFDDEAPCIAGEVNYFNEGDNITFNISVDYTDGGPSGMRQEIKLVHLGVDPVLVKLKSNFGPCIVNRNLPSNVKDRIAFRRIESNSWFDIEINMTNALPSDSEVYPVVLEAEDLMSSGSVTKSTSLVTVSVIPTPRIPLTSTSCK